jgi:hypothetical protein
MPATEGTPATAGMTPTKGMALTAGLEAAPCFQEANLGPSFGCFVSKLRSFEGHPPYAHPMYKYYMLVRKWSHNMILKYYESPELIN